MFNNINPIAWTALGTSWGGTFAQLTSIGLERDTMLSLAGSIVAMGAVLMPAAIKWFKSFRAAQREEDLSDHSAHATQLAAEVIRRAEAEAKIAELERQLAELKTAQPSPLQDGRQEGVTSKAQQS